MSMRRLEYISGIICYHIRAKITQITPVTAPRESVRVRNPMICCLHFPLLKYHQWTHSVAVPSPHDI